MYPTVESVFPGPRVSPRASGPFRGFRKEGPGSRRIVTGATPHWFVPLRRRGNFSSGLSGRRLSGRGQPRGSGETQASNGNGKCRRGRIPIPSLGAAAPSGAPACRNGSRFSPWGAMIVWGGRQDVRQTHVPGAALAPGASGPSFAGHKVQGSLVLVRLAPLVFPNLAHKTTNYLEIGISPLGVVDARFFAPARDKNFRAKTGVQAD